MKAGSAAIDYTPLPGLPLMGNYRDEYGARGVHDPLYARALAFEDDAGARAAILSVDICMMDRVNVAFVRDCVSADCGLEPGRLLVAATHTHSAPAPMRLGSLPKCDDGAIALFLRKAAGAVSAALEDLQPAELRAGVATEGGLSFNRRLLCTDGATHMNWERPEPGFVVRALGPIDPEVRVLAVRRAGRQVAAAVNFALHPAILAGDNWLYSADFPGYLAQAMAGLAGNDFVAAFWNGCAGNVNHLDYADPLQGRGFKEAQRVGYALALKAERAARQATAVPGGPVAVSREFVELRRLPVSAERAEWCRAVLQQRKPPGEVDGLPDEYYAATGIGMYQNQHTPDRAEVMAMRIGNVGIVGLPGEVFCEYGLQIKRRSPAPHTMVVELANDAVGYLPTAEAFAQGGYEPSAGATFYTADAGSRLADSAIRQLEGLFGA
ncbi:MAG TPA: neutral/alkaline non-lysosomal ceramidase N-terminal domain-containing protein [Bryobacteraceae bacterium]|nr:neutral/alkaline non-lysosomal ceramidase N-terminal domain-containing protein [Bryobacteraceae bacterium]